LSSSTPCYRAVRALHRWTGVVLARPAYRARA
jgi:hypothetical protein